MKRYLIILCLLAIPALAASENVSLESGFANPPESAKPRTWWHWVSGNVSAEGITADLEAMKRVGLGGAQIFTVDQSDVHGPVKFMSAEWRSLVHHALDVAGKLGLEISMEGCDGWSESGGPWVTPAQGMQKLVWTETHASGGERVVIASLPKADGNLDYYEDVACFAYLLPAGEPPTPAAITSSASPTAFQFQSSGAPWELPKSPAPQWVRLEYDKPVKAQSLRIVVKSGWRKGWELQAGDDGETFHKVCALSSDEIVTFPTTTGKFFRLYNNTPSTSPVFITALTLDSGRVDRYRQRVGLAVDRKINTFNSPLDSSTLPIEQAKVVNLAGVENWEAPAGQWTVVRLGHTAIGTKTHPSTLAGLECDKMSKAAVEAHFHGMFGPVMSDSPDSIGTTLKYVLLDSWEAGCENWTPLMREEFAKRRGYDLGPWLPVLTGRIVSSRDESERFLWDYRRTLADLVADEHYGTLQSLARSKGMGLAAEATGQGMPTIADQLQCKGRTDIPMGEFWTLGSSVDVFSDAREAACAAHIYGQNIAATESFTSTAAPASWKNDPYSLKALGDQEFCNGVNRFVFHRYAHQPWLDRAPGMSMGPWGINFERTNTWWEQGAAWLGYLSRSEFMLQRGRFVADLCYFYGEGAPVCVSRDGLLPVPPRGFGFDVCNAEILLNRMTVEDGHLALPSGMRYRVLVLPENDRMTLPVLQKIRDLVQAGATVYGPKPLKSPSLLDYPRADEALASTASELWGSCDGKSVFEHPFGKGKIVWGKSLEQVLSTPPDFTASEQTALYIHRLDKDGDIYFVSNQLERPITMACTFRVEGKAPELWHPDTGRVESAALYKTGNGTTTLPIPFDPLGSVFVVFRRPDAVATRVASATLNGKALFEAGSEPTASLPEISGGNARLVAHEPGAYEITNGEGISSKQVVPALPPPLAIAGPWRVTFPPKLGAPDSATFDHLMSWTDSPDEGVRYFSGTARYSMDFTLPEGFTGAGHLAYLDLGNVKNLAQVSLNGQQLGILWKPPFRTEITNAIKTGANHLEVRITNLWPNRMIGDQKLPQDKRITWASVSPYKADSPLLPSGLLGPVTIQAGQLVDFKR